MTQNSWVALSIQPKMKASETRSTKTPFWKTRTGSGIVIAVISAAALIIAALLPVVLRHYSESSPNHAVTSGGPKGEILSRKKNDAVATPFDVEGTLQGIPEDYHVWLAVQVDNLLWPKREIPSGDQRWMRRISETGGSGKRFAVVLLMVNQEGHREVQSWFRCTEQAGDYSGIEKISGSTVLDIVQMRLR